MLRKVATVGIAIALTLDHTEITVLTESRVVNFITSDTISGEIGDRCRRVGSRIDKVGVANSGSALVVGACGGTCGAAISVGLVVGPRSQIGADGIETTSLGAIRGSSCASGSGVGSGDTGVLRSLTTKACKSGAS